MWYLINNILTTEASDKTLKFSVQLNGYDILIIRKSNNYYAVNMECPHAGKSLLKGTCTEANEIVCPFHSFKFDLTTGACTNNNEGFRLRTFETKIENNQFYVFVR